MPIPEDIDTPVNIETLCREVLEANRHKPASLEDLKREVMKLSKWKANPRLVIDCLNTIRLEVI